MTLSSIATPSADPEALLPLVPLKDVSSSILVMLAERQLSTAPRIRQTCASSREPSAIACNNTSIQLCRLNRSCLRQRDRGIAAPHANALSLPIQDNGAMTIRARVIPGSC